MASDSPGRLELGDAATSCVSSEAHDLPERGVDRPRASDGLGRAEWLSRRGRESAAWRRGRAERCVLRQGALQRPGLLAVEHERCLQRLSRATTRDSCTTRYSCLTSHGYTGVALSRRSNRNLHRRRPGEPAALIDEQRRIVCVLGALDDKIDSNRRLAALLEETAATLFRARFVDFVGVEEFDDSEIGPIPVGGRSASLGGSPRFVKQSVPIAT